MEILFALFMQSLADCLFCYLNCIRVLICLQNRMRFTRVRNCFAVVLRFGFFHKGLRLGQEKLSF